MKKRLQSMQTFTAVTTTALTRFSYEDEQKQLRNKRILLFDFVRHLHWLNNNCERHG